MLVTAFKDLPLANRDRKWDGNAAEKRVRKWAGARGGIDLPKDDVGRVRSHLAKHYKKMDESAPWERG